MRSMGSFNKDADSLRCEYDYSRVGLSIGSVHLTIQPVPSVQSNVVKSITRVTVKRDK